jgi:hypothetical protein
MALSLAHKVKLRHIVSTYVRDTMLLKPRVSFHIDKINNFLFQKYNLYFIFEFLNFFSMIYYILLWKFISHGENSDIGYPFISVIQFFFGFFYLNFIKYFNIFKIQFFLQWTKWLKKEWKIIHSKCWDIILHI